MSKTVLMILATIVLLGGCQLKNGGNTVTAPLPAMTSFVDDYFNALYDWRPSDGTAAGFHQYDARLEDFSVLAVTKRIEKLKELQVRLERLRRSHLILDDEIDAEILDGQIRAELLDLETLQTWRHNPIKYVSLPGRAINGLIKRDFAPALERLKAVTARLKAVPALLDAMQKNIDNPPKEFTEEAIEGATGSADFFDNTLMKWAKETGSTDTTLLSDFSDANRAATQSLRKAVVWLKETLLPQSKGDYAIGKDHFSKKLLYEEMVDLPLDRILSICEEKLDRDRQAFEEIARQIDQSRSTADVMKLISDDHPTEQSLIDDGKKTIEPIRQFLIDKQVVTIPSEVRPTVMPKPPYAPGSFASIDTPGAYETEKAIKAFYYIAAPEKGWDAKRKEKRLRFFTPPKMKVITIHEVFPGHYLQFLYAKQFPTKTRQLIAVASNAEGWAHYAEQMMIEEGFGDGDLKIRFMQLSLALQRDCRCIVGIKMHTARMTFEDGKKCFVEKGSLESVDAEDEWRRGTYDPTYLVYTLGKLQIYKLREDYKRAKDAAYTLKSFHDAFVKQGSIPIKLIRRLLLSGDQGPSL